MKNSRYAATGLVLIASAMLSGCENLVSEDDGDRAQDMKDYFRESAPQAEAMAPVFEEPVYVQYGIKVKVGDSVKIRIRGGTMPLTLGLDLDQGIGYIVFDPENSMDERTYKYVAEKPGHCVITVRDALDRLDFIETTNY